MATNAQIERILEKMKKASPAELFRDLSETQSGMMAVLAVLSDSDGEVSAGKISQVLNVSTARVAALLKKMAAKGLITKERDALDARVMRVELTDLGRQTAAGIRGKIHEQIGTVIDAVGEERLLEFIAISSEIKAVLERASPPDLGF